MVPSDHARGAVLVCSGIAWEEAAYAPPFHEFPPLLPDGAREQMGSRVGGPDDETVLELAVPAPPIVHIHFVRDGIAKGAPLPPYALPLGVDPPIDQAGTGSGRPKNIVAGRVAPELPDAIACGHDLAWGA